MQATAYGYGHTKESAQIVRDALNQELANVKKPYGLKISVRKANSGYGGPRVEITTPHVEFDKRYQFIIDDNGQPADCGTLIDAPVSTFPNGRPHYSARLITPEITEKFNARVKKVLTQFGRDNDDSMTDYFDNTTPLFYGIEYKKEAL